MFHVNAIVTASDELTENARIKLKKMFKCKFVRNTRFEFWIGKKVWNSEVYDELCKEVGISKNEEFFPAYRKAL